VNKGCHQQSNSVDGTLNLTMSILTFLFLLINSDHIEGVKEVAASLEFMVVNGIKLELEGLVICDEDGDKIHDEKLKNKIIKDPSVQDVVKVLGPGYLSPISGTGGVFWYFSDGSRLTTVLWPKNLNTKVKLITPESQ